MQKDKDCTGCHPQKTDGVSVVKPTKGSQTPWLLSGDSWNDDDDWYECIGCGGPAKDTWCGFCLNEE